jgi:O-acetyl-ADP-ribose deacetylase (regulator of RNase III)
VRHVATVPVVSPPAIAVWRGDIAECAEVDAVVNAANEHLTRGSGVCGAIFRTAGTRQLTDACDEIGHCATGDAVVTPGFGLSARWIIHTVGPRWIDGDHGEAELLASCYRRVLQVADEIGARSVAFPAISTGIFGVPAELGGRTAIAAIRAASTDVEQVLLVGYDDEWAARWTRLLAAR